MKRILTLISIAGFFGPSSIADIDLNVDLSIMIGKPIETHEHVVVEKGPPAWAPAHGRRAKGTFIYYPAHQVYRNTRTGAWVYYQNGDWRIGVNLPSIIHIGSDSRYVSLEMSSDLPYHYHNEVMRYYPASVATVTVSHQTVLHGHPGKSRGGPPQGHPGKGKGKNK